MRREQRRSRRAKAGIPILANIGYTNAGKSTLFNLLTRSQFQVEEKLFSTLDTATRRLKFPKIHKIEHEKGAEKITKSKSRNPYSCQHRIHQCRKIDPFQPPHQESISGGRETLFNT